MRRAANGVTQPGPLAVAIEFLLRTRSGALVSARYIGGAAQ
jgi:hypothetical protein